MRVVFKEGGTRTHAAYPGLLFPAPIPFIATKAAATRVKKRPRDAFDVYVTARGQAPEQLKDTWGKLAARDQLFHDANAALCKAVDPQTGDAIEKIMAVLEALATKTPGAFQMPPSSEVEATFDFLLR